MSYFMVAVGPRPDLSDIPGVEAIPFMEAQEYLQKLAIDLSKAHGVETIWFVHDGESGTSHDLITDAYENIQLHGSLAGTILERVLLACENAGDAFRIWMAGENSQAHLDVDRFSVLGEAMMAIVEHIRSGKTVAIAYDGKR